jgi:hypothetical protein
MAPRTRHNPVSPIRRSARGGSFLGFCRSQFAAAKILRIHLRPAFPPFSRAPRGLQAREGPLAAASPQTPWLGGTVSALRLVTCWSSDALRLSSSGRTGRKSPLKAAVRYASSLSLTDLLSEHLLTFSFSDYSE